MIDDKQAIGNLVPHSITLAGLPIATRRVRPARARFLARPNRFTAVVSLRGGARALAHLPNPGRLTGVVSPGCQALLDGPFPPPRTLPYTMVAARQSATWIGTDTTYANRPQEEDWGQALPCDNGLR